VIARKIKVCKTLQNFVATPIELKYQTENTPDMYFDEPVTMTNCKTDNFYKFEVAIISGI